MYTFTVLHTISFIGFVDRIPLINCLFVHFLIKTINFSLLYFQWIYFSTTYIRILYRTSLIRLRRMYFKLFLSLSIFADYSIPLF